MSKVHTPKDLEMEWLYYNGQISYIDSAERIVENLVNHILELEKEVQRLSDEVEDLRLEKGEK